MRPGTAGAGRALEWGQDTDQPGSRVRDVDGRPIFTGSRVELVTPAGREREVVELVDEHHIRVGAEHAYGPLSPTRSILWRVVS